MTNTQTYYGLTHVFDSRSDNPTTTLKAGKGEILEVTGRFSEAALTAYRSAAAIYLSSPAATSATISTWTKIAGSTASINLYNFTAFPSNKLIYTGAVAGLAHINYTVSATGSTSDVVTFGLSKNGGTPVADSWIETTVVGGVILSVSGSANILLTSTDYVEVFLLNTSSGDNVTATKLNINIIGMF